MTVIAKFFVVLMLSAAGLAYLMRPSVNEEQPPAAANGQLAVKQGAEPRFDLPTASQYAMPDRVQVGIFEVDNNGNLIIDRTTLGRMDVLLAGIPLQASTQDMQRIEEIVKAGLPNIASHKALRILHGYIDYRKAEAMLLSEPQPVDAAGVHAVLSRIIALRKQHLGEEVADALFLVQDAQARVSIETARIEADANLSPGEKASRIAALQKTLPARAIGEERDADAQAALAQQVAALRQRGAPEADVQRLRERQLGAEGAQQMTDMESQKSQWERRYIAFSQQKNAILAAPISEPQKQEKIEALLRQHYNEQEIDTARAYDRGSGRR